MHADDLVSTAPSSGLSGELQRKPALGLDSHTLYQTASSYCDPPFSFLFFCSVHVYAWLYVTVPECTRGARYIRWMWIHRNRWVYAAFVCEWAEDGSLAVGIHALSFGITSDTVKLHTLLGDWRGRCAIETCLLATRDSDTQGRSLPLQLLSLADPLWVDPLTSLTVLQNFPSRSSTYFLSAVMSNGKPSNIVVDVLSRDARYIMH